MTKRIPLSKGYFAKVDDLDYRSVSQFKWSADVSILPSGLVIVYASRKVRIEGINCKIYMHRYIVSGNLLGKGDFITDHRDGDGLNNRRNNLRKASQSQNRANTRKRKGTTSGYKGVSFHPQTGKWRAAVWSNGKKRHIGLFNKEQDAAKAYNTIALETFGEFARLNIVR